MKKLLERGMKVEGVYQEYLYEGRFLQFLSDERGFPYAVIQQDDDTIAFVYDIEIIEESEENKD